MDLTQIKDINLIVYRYAVIAPDHELKVDAQVEFVDLQKTAGLANEVELKVVPPSDLDPLQEHNKVVGEGNFTFYCGQIHDSAFVMRAEHFQNDRLRAFNSAFIAATTESNESDSIIQIAVQIESKVGADLKKIVNDIFLLVPKQDQYLVRDAVFEWNGCDCGRTDRMRHGIWVCVAGKDDVAASQRFVFQDLLQISLAETKILRFRQSWKSGGASKFETARKKLRGIASQSRTPGLNGLEERVSELTQSIGELTDCMHFLERLITSAKINLGNIQSQINAPGVPDSTRESLGISTIRPMQMVVDEFENTLAYGRNDLEAARLQLELAETQASLLGARWTRKSTYILAIFAAAGVVQVVMGEWPSFAWPGRTGAALAYFFTNGKLWALIVLLVSLWIISAIVLLALEGKWRWPRFRMSKKK